MSGGQKRLNESANSCRKSPTAGKPNTKNHSLRKRSETDDPRAAPVLVTPSATLTTTSLWSRQIMAERNGNTAPKAQADGLRHSLTTPPSELLPVKPEVFQALYETNTQFQKLIHQIETLQTIPFFPHRKLTAWQNFLSRMQAEANFSFTAMIHQREERNATYFDRLCARWEQETEDPDDVLLKAEYRKQQLAEEKAGKEEGFEEEGSEDEEIEVQDEEEVEDENSEEKDNNSEDEEEAETEDEIEEVE